MDNNTIAVLTKVNELLERHAIHPCDVVVTLRSGEHGTVLFFEAPPKDAAAENRYFRMLASLGLSGAQLKLAGDDRDIYDKLQAALDVAPRPRPGR